MRRLIAGLTVTMLLMAACGSATSKDASPTEVLNGALDDLEAAESLTTTFSLISTPESLQAAASEDGSELSAGDAAKILDSSLTVSGKTSGAADAPAEVILNIAGIDVIEVRVVDATLYARADVNALAETFGGDPAEIDAVADQLAAGGMTYVKAAVDGQWVALQGFKQLVEGYAGQSAQPEASDEDKQLLEQFTASIRDNASVTDAGSDDAGRHLVASVPLRETYEDFANLAANLSEGVGGAGMPAGELPDAGEIPDEDAELDVWVRDGRVTQMEFDFLQVGRWTGEETPEGLETMALRIALADFSGEVTAPEEPVVITPEQIIQDFAGGSLTG